MSDRKGWALPHGGLYLTDEEADAFLDAVAGQRCHHDKGETQCPPPPERAILTDLIAELRDVHSAFKVCNECPDWGDDCGDHDRMTVCRACCTEGDGWHTMHCADTHPGTGSRLTDHCPTVASLDRAEERLREVSDE